MNQAGYMFLLIFGSLFAVVLVILSIPYLSPFAGAASAGLNSTSTNFSNLLPFIGAILAGGGALAALSRTGRR